MKLIVHIGLPKTGTTFLQKKIFPLLFKNNYLWRRLIGDKNAESKIRDIERFLRSQGANLNSLSLETLTSYTEPALISNENISIMPSMWEQSHIIQPEVIAINLLRLSNLLYKNPLEVGVLVTIRRQDLWFASRYAESSKRMPNPSQDDFEAKVRSILEKKSSHKYWLDYDYLRTVFEAVLPASRLLFLTQEELEANPINAIDKLFKFANIQASLPQDILKEKVNALSISKNCWQFKPYRANGLQRDEYLCLTDELSRIILDAYDVSNRQFCIASCPEISRYGYY